VVGGGTAVALGTIAVVVDRRRTYRVPCDLPVLWRRGWRDVSARACDLDTDGLFLATSHSIPVDQTMDLVVTLPDGPVRVLGVARYLGVTRHGRGIGVAILAITAEDRTRWLSWYRAEVEAMTAARTAG
jgi:hypothetical protein